MTDSEAISIDHCRDLLDSEADDSEAQIAAIRDHADAMAHFIIDLFIEQRATPPRPATSALLDGAGSIPVWLHETSFEINELAAVAFSGIEPRKFLALNHLRRIGNVVDQICPRWNPLTSWMREIEHYQRAA